MSSWTNAISEALTDPTVSTALDAVQTLRCQYPTGLSYVAEHQQPKMHTRVTDLTAWVAANPSEGATASDTGFTVHWFDGWWVLVGTIYKDPARAGSVDPQSPLVLHHRGEDLVLYGPAVATLARQVLANGLVHDVLSNVCTG